MSNTTAIYSKGSLMKEMSIAGLVRNTVVDGVVQEGQASYTWIKMIEETNAYYEQNGGAGNKMLEIYKDEIAYTGDPSVTATISNATSIGGGRFKVEFTAAQAGFRVDDGIGTGFGQKLARVAEAYDTYVIVDTYQGYSAPVIGDFPVGKDIIQYGRQIGLRGTKTPQGLNIRPQVWENYVSVWDDGLQQNLFDNKMNTVIKVAEDYIRIAPVTEMMERFFRNGAMNQFVSRGVNPELTNFNYSATKGIHQQIQDRGTYIPQTSVITRQEFEQAIRQNYIANPGNDIRNKVILTGAIGMAQIGEWYKDQIKFDSQIAMSFTDGSINGLNATKIFIPGFEFINVVHWKLLNMNAMGAPTTIAGYAGLPQTAGSFYIMDFNPVRTQTGATAPAFQNIFYGGSKYYFAYQAGLTAMDSLQGIIANATPLTMSTLENTSTDADFSNMRIYSLKGLNVMNPTAHTWIQNLV